jgi:acetolactate synthase-1/2/3 large subunit
MDALPDFVKLSESFGHVGLKIEKPSDVDTALKDAIKLKDRLVFIDFITDQNENVFPMIATGAAHNKMILS